LLFHVLNLTFIHANHLLHRLSAECKQQPQNPAKPPVTAADCNFGLMMFHSFFYGKKEM